MPSVGVIAVGIVVRTAVRRVAGIVIWGVRL